MTTTIVNYGAGNIRSVENTLAELDAQYEVTNDPAVVLRATKIILPGVGHFGQMMLAIDKLGLRQPLKEKIAQGIPFLGICVGLQCSVRIKRRSPGRSRPRRSQRPSQTFRRQGAHSPHGLEFSRPAAPYSPLRRPQPPPLTLTSRTVIYAPLTTATAATCTYLLPYSAVLEQANLHAVQFHPEKSGPVGLKVVKNFLEI